MLPSWARLIDNGSAPRIEPTAVTPAYATGEAPGLALALHSPGVLGQGFIGEATDERGENLVDRDQHL